MKNKLTATLPLALLAIGVLGSVTSANAGLNNSIYVALDTPCRVGDTRHTATPAIPAGGDVEWHAYGVDMSAQGGDASGCPQPKEGMTPTGIAVNITAAGKTPLATGDGNLVVYPADATAPTTSVVNYTPGANIANSTIVGLCQDGACDGKFIIQSNLSDVRAIADVQGYFYAQPSGIANVAISGGDYSSPVDAMNDLATWCGTPSEDNLCLMKIAPGEYNIGANPIIMQDFVDIQGSGTNNTEITGAVAGDASSGLVHSATNTTLSDLSIYNEGGSGGSYSIGIFSEDAGNVLIKGVYIEAYGGTNNIGIRNSGSSLDIINSSIYGSGGEHAIGIENSSLSVATIMNANVTSSGASISNIGISIVESHMLMDSSEIKSYTVGGERATGIYVSNRNIPTSLNNLTVFVEGASVENNGVIVDSAYVEMKVSKITAKGPGSGYGVTITKSETIDPVTDIVGSTIVGETGPKALLIDANVNPDNTRIVNNAIWGGVENNLPGGNPGKKICLGNYKKDLAPESCN